MQRTIAAIALLVVACTASAQPYPNRPVRVIAAQSAGSSLDTIARIVMTRVSEILGQQMVIDNRGGAGGTIGIELAARATPDGYTIVVGASSSMLVSRFTYRSLPFDALKDFDAIANLVDADAVLVVHPAVPAKSVKELIALVKAQPGKLNMASAGVGSSSHLAGTLFATMAGIEVVHVPYKGGGPMASAVVGGEAQWAISPAAALMGHIRSGRMRALAISSPERSPVLPELPTIAEAGVPGYEYGSWNGVFAPRGTPRPAINTMFGAIQKALADPEVRKLYAVQGLSPATNKSPEAFDKYFRADYDRIVKIVQAAGIKPE
jgi:tripartite-type tricarboxylate transporter receptor subunit TctC